MTNIRWRVVGFSGDGGKNFKHFFIKEFFMLKLYKYG